MKPLCKMSHLVLFADAPWQELPLLLHCLFAFFAKRKMWGNNNHISCRGRFFGGILSFACQQTIPSLSLHACQCLQVTVTASSWNLDLPKTFEKSVELLLLGTTILILQSSSMATQLGKKAYENIYITYKYMYITFFPSSFCCNFCCAYSQNFEFIISPPTSGPTTGARSFSSGWSVYRCWSVSRFSVFCIGSSSILTCCSSLPQTKVRDLTETKKSYPALFLRDRACWSLQVTFWNWNQWTAVSKKWGAGWHYPTSESGLGSLMFPEHFENESLTGKSVNKGQWQRFRAN